MKTELANRIVIIPSDDVPPKGSTRDLYRWSGEIRVYNWSGIKNHALTGGDKLPPRPKISPVK